MREVASFREGIRDLPTATHCEPQELRARLAARYDFTRPRPLGELAREVMALLRETGVQVTHPRHFGLFNPSVREAAIVADTLAALYNPQLAVWPHAPAVCELERLTLRRFADALGLDPESTLATFTTGGAEANLSAVLAALAQRHPEADRAGVAGLPARPALYVSEESHHSFVKIVRMTGLGTGALRFVPVDDEYRLETEALRERLRIDRARGWLPLLIVGTAGTTSSGAIDPLDRLADVAAAEDIWFHVDAAWGGAAVLSDRLRPWLAGIERADSVTWDAHKWLSVPMGAGMFFCRWPEAVRRAFRVSTQYMPDTESTLVGDTESTLVDDPYMTSVQWSRRAIGLKVFMALAELGVDGYAALIEHQAEMGDALRRRLHANGWRVLNRTPLPVVCFRQEDGYGPDPRRLAARIQRRGRAWISDLVLGKVAALRACITSFRTREEDLEILIDELQHASTYGG